MKEQLLERFIRYVKINTCSAEDSDTTPSTRHQFDLANVLVKEMKQIGIKDAWVDEHCYVYGSIPATEGCEDSPALGFIAHLDTVSDYCSKNVEPVIHENYNGEDIVLPKGGITIETKNFPHLKEMKGRTLITSDGTTILGADDKAGIAEIMTVADYLIKNKVPHGKICIAFTPDEEIGSGAELLDIDTFGAAFAFTMDGDLEGGIEYENFNAASAKIEFRGVNVHPGSAKNVMVNAAVVATEFQLMLPSMEQPAYTEGYEGFYHLMGMSGAVDSAHLNYIIRDHDKAKFEERKATIGKIAAALNEKYGPGTVTAEVADSYYNMVEIINEHLHLVEHAKEACIKAGVTPVVKPVRGGTDGACLSFRGLPCPNLGDGGEAFHGPYEHITLEGMEKAVQIILHIIQSYIK